ncbi:hypothetical protein BHM03_00018463 [Ensete ventricosum]|uniref:Uncharacterized protein n=1 Tax=Ensete ventricosum TaxID=4639 RepID=A0A445MF56_ENSVE|nr:hypothetical protein BHM03_00018463 [Ensete ventricosum]
MGTVNFALVGPSHHMCVEPDPGSHPTDAYSSVECPGEKFMGKPVPFDRITPDVMQGRVGRSPSAALMRRDDVDTEPSSVPCFASPGCHRSLQGLQR